MKPSNEQILRDALQDIAMCTYDGNVCAHKAQEALRAALAATAPESAPTLAEMAAKLEAEASFVKSMEIGADIRKYIAGELAKAESAPMSELVANHQAPKAAHMARLFAESAPPRAAPQSEKNQQVSICNEASGQQLSATVLPESAPADAPTEAWLIEWPGQTQEEAQRLVTFHNSAGDYRALGLVGVTATELVRRTHPAPSQSAGIYPDSPDWKPLPEELPGGVFFGDECIDRKDLGKILWKLQGQNVKIDYYRKADIIAMLSPRLAASSAAKGEA